MADPIVNPFATPAPDPTPGVGAATQSDTEQPAPVVAGNPYAVAAPPPTAVTAGSGGEDGFDDDRVATQDASVFGIFSNAWSDLKDIGTGLTTLASTAYSDLKTAIVDPFDDEDHDYVMDNMWNAVWGVGEFSEGGSVILNDYQARYGGGGTDGVGGWAAHTGEAIYQHPLSFISDALMVVTAGGSAAAKGAQFASKVGLAGPAAKAGVEAAQAATLAEKAALTAAKVAKGGDEVATAAALAKSATARSAADAAKAVAAAAASNPTADDVGRIANLVKTIEGSARRVINPETGKVIQEAQAVNPVRRLLYQNRYLNLKAPTLAYWQGRAEKMAALAEAAGPGAVRYAEKAQMYRTLVEKALAAGAKDGDNVMSLLSDAPIGTAREAAARALAARKASKFVDFTVGFATGKSHQIPDRISRSYADNIGSLIDGEVTHTEDLVDEAMGNSSLLTDDGIVTPEAARLADDGTVRPLAQGTRRVEEFEDGAGDLPDLAGDVRYAHGEEDGASGAASEFDEVNRLIDEKTVSVEGTRLEDGMSARTVERLTQRLNAGMNANDGTVEQLDELGEVWVLRGSPTDPADRTFFKLGKDGKVISYREVTGDGKVIAETVTAAQRRGHGITLGEAHWADEGVTTLEQARALIAKQEFSAGGANLNKRLVQNLAARQQAKAGTVMTAPRPRLPAVGTPGRETFDAAIAAAKEARVTVTQKLRQRVGNRFKVTSKEVKGEESIRAQAELLDDDWTGVDDISGFRMESEDMHKGEVQREAIKAIEESTGGKVRRVENTMNRPAPDGSRMVRVIVEMPDGSPAEFQLMTPDAAKVYNATGNLRGLMKVQAVLNKRGVLVGDDALRFEKATRISQQLWEGVTDTMREARGGPAASKVRAGINRFRVDVFEQMTDPLLGRGLDIHSVFDNAYMPLRYKNGGQYLPGVNGDEGAMVGGTSPLMLDDVLAGEGKMAPMYYPMMDVERLPKRGDFLRRGGAGARSTVDDQNLKRNTGRILSEGTYSKDAAHVWRVRAAQSARMQEHMDILFDTVAEYGRPLRKGEELNDGEVAFSPGLVKRLASQHRAMMDTLMNDPSGKGLGDLLKELANHNALRMKELLDEGEPVFAVPKHVAKRLDKHSGVALKELLGGEAASFFVGTPTSLWKTATLAGRPAWMVNNFISNVMFLKLQGGNFRDVVRQLDRSYLAKLREAIGPEALEHIESGGLYADSVGSTGRAWDESTVLGKIASFGQRNVAQSRVGTKVAKGADRVQRLNSIMEDAFRRASYMEASGKAVERASIQRSAGLFWKSHDRLQSVLATGLDEDLWRGAVDDMNKYMNDYATMSPFARQVTKPYIAPFWSFYRHAAKLLLTMPFDHPAKSRLFALMNEVDDERNRSMGIDPNLLPGWMRSDVLFTSRGDAGDFRGMSNGGMNPFNGVTQAPLNLVHPLWKVFMEQSTGRSTFTGEAFTDKHTVTNFGSEQQYRIDGSGQAKQVEKVAPSLFEHLLQQVPQYELAKDVIAGGTTYDTSTLMDVILHPEDEVIIDSATGEPYKKRDIIYGIGKMFGYSDGQYDPEGMAERELQKRADAVKAYLKEQALREGTEAVLPGTPVPTTGPYGAAPSTAAGPYG